MLDETQDSPTSVRCPCGKLVTPTVPGGNRPRPHVDEATKRRCTRYSEKTAAVCKRCGGAPDQPKTVLRGGKTVTCTSTVFHPKTWSAKVTRSNGYEEVTTVGNAAACGEVLGVSGEQWQWYGREPEEGTPSRAPEPDGYDLHRRVPFWALDKVRAFRDQLPSRTRESGTPSAPTAEAEAEAAPATPAEA